MRFGGAGAVFPFLFVVRLICTKLLLEPPVNVVSLVAMLLKLSAEKITHFCGKKLIKKMNKTDRWNFARTVPLNRADCPYCPNAISCTTNAECPTVPGNRYPVTVFLLLKRQKIGSNSRSNFRLKSSEPSVILDS